MLKPLVATLALTVQVGSPLDRNPIVKMAEPPSHGGRLFTTLPVGGVLHLLEHVPENIGEGAVAKGHPLGRISLIIEVLMLAAVGLDR